MSETPTGEQLRDEGMSEAIANERQFWHEHYHRAVDIWFAVQLKPGQTFTGERLREVALHAGVIGEPHHPNVWGANAASAIRRWLKSGRVIEDGFAKAISPKSHAHHYRRYRRSA